MNTEFLTIAEVKDYLKISQSAAYGLTRRNDFPIARFGGTIRIPKAAFLAWVDSVTVMPKELVSQIKAA